ncbi:MAG: hypothetical protein FJX76_10465 [Armatimonadetes bacterium]|nr:hypothetical protein [Armatimonadota bacterium]
MTTPLLKIGILSGKETFTDVLVEEINRRAIPNVKAEFCTIPAARIFEPSPYRVILDRISHWITYYRTYLKNVALTGTYVINNPFWFSADDKFYNYSLARKLEVAVPRTVCLPSRSYHDEVETSDLRNLAYPIDWEGIVSYIGFPAVLKPYDGYGWRDVTVVADAQELMDAYNDSGEDVMLLQEYIDWEHYVRAIVVGKKYVLPIKYDPAARRYLIDHRHLSDEMGKLIVRDCIRLNEALGYDLNTVEFAIRDGVPYAIDFMNPVPEAKPEVITHEYFKWLVRHLADVLIEYAVSGKRTPTQLREDDLERLQLPTPLAEDARPLSGGIIPSLNRQDAAADEALRTPTVPA